MYEKISFVKNSECLKHNRKEGEIDDRQKKEIGEKQK